MAERSDREFWSMLRQIERAGNVYALRSAVMDTLKLVGFNAAYFLAPVVTDPTVGRVLTNIGFADEWASRYASEFAEIDPLPQIALTRRAAFFWPQGLAGIELTDKQERYLKLLREYGMDRGIAVACFGPFARIGFAGVGLADSPDCYNEEARLKVEMCSRSCFQRYADLTQPYEDISPKLTPLESQVLRKLAEGQREREISNSLGVALEDARQAIQNLLTLLQVKDPAEVAMKALALGLVVSGHYPLQSR